MATKKHRYTRSGGFSGAKAYMWYVKCRKKCHDAVDRSFYDAIILAIALLLGGCQPKVYLMPTPIGIDHAPLAFELSENSKDSNLLYTLFATNRRPFESPLNNRRYTIFPSDSLRLGYVVHRVGDKYMSWDDLQRESLEGGRSQDLLIDQIWSREMAHYDLANNMTQKSGRAEGFFYEINQALDKMYNKDLLVYVHGANSNFYRGTAQGSQYFHFTGHNTVVLTFSWPSAENLLKYKTDVLHARQTVPAFARLIEVLAKRTEAEKINILAYSAGAQVVSPGLAYFRKLYPGLEADEIKKQLRIGEVYLAAPDTDFAPFVDRYMKFKDIVDRTTINLNQNDKILRFAALQNGISRLGRPDRNELTVEEGQALVEALHSDKLDILNVGDSSALRLGGAHDSWYTHPWVSNDLLLLMLFNASPEQRGLVEYRLGNGEKGYYFPDNYDQVIREILKKGREEFQKKAQKEKETREEDQPDR